MIQDKLVQVQFSWCGFWPKFPMRCPNVGTNSRVVFVVHPNHRRSLYVLGCVPTTIWPSFLTGSHLALAGGNVTWTSYPAPGPVSLPQNHFHYSSQSKCFYTTVMAMVCRVSCRVWDHLTEVSLGVSPPTGTIQQMEGEAFSKLGALRFGFGHEPMKEAS